MSYQSHEVFTDAAIAARDRFFGEQQIASLIPAHSSLSGFIFTNLDGGFKFAKVLLISRDGTEQFAFTLAVAGERFLGNGLAVERIYPADRIRSLDLGQWRQWLEGIGCCTSNEAGTSDGDPLNLVVVEGRAGRYPAFIEQGWHLANVLDARSAVETIESFLVWQDLSIVANQPVILAGSRRGYRTPEKSCYDQPAQPFPAVAGAGQLREPSRLGGTGKPRHRHSIF